jgi:outer membrane autotransporter protein
LFTLSANLAGTLRAVVQPGLYGTTTVYNGVVVACSCNGLNGTKFDTVTSSSTFFIASATYDYAGVTPPINDPNVSLTLTRIPFGSVPGETRNQQAVGNYLESNYSTSLTGPAATFFSTLLAGPSVAPLDQLSGEGTGGTQESAFMAVNLFMAALENQGTAWLAGGPASPNGAAAPMQYAAAAPEHPAFKALHLAAEPRRWNIWGAGFGGDETLHGDPVIGSADLSHRSAGGAVGVNYQADPDLLLGLAVGGSASDFSVPDRMTSGHLDGAHLGAFAVSRQGPLYALGTASYGWFDNSTTRDIVGVGAGETATGRFASNQLGGRLEVGWRQPVERLTVTPFAAVQFLRLWQQGYTETSVTSAGAPGVLGLTFQPHAVSSLPTFLGAQVETRFEFRNGMAWAPYGRVSWVHEFDPTRDITASLSLLPAGGFTVDGARAASNSARVEAGSNLYLSSMISLFGNFTGEFSHLGSSYAGNAGVRVAW